MKARVLALSSQVAFGPVGNSATAPALEALAFEVLQVPTVVLSYHPGHGAPAGFRTAADKLSAICEALLDKGMLDDCVGVFTGYFADAAQVSAAAAFIAKLRERRSLRYFCDPVIGDDPDGLYVAEAVALAIRDELLPLADMIAPNRFELEWLSGRAVPDREAAEEAGRKLKPPEVLATSIPGGASLLTLAIADHVSCFETARLAAVPHGTGDHLSGLYFGERLLGAPPETALKRAMARLMAVIAASAGSKALVFPAKS